MRSCISLFIFCSLLVPQATLAKAGPFWGADSEADSILRRSEARREERARRRFTSPSHEPQVRIGWSIISRPASPRRRRNVQPALITGVIDGSIVIVRLQDEGNTEIRLLGIDAPERNRVGIECFAYEARDALRHTFAGTSVVLERDKRYHRDSYRRLVRYVRSGSQDIGAWMIWHGYAFADYSLQHLRLSEYEDFESDARRHERGMWGYDCDYNDALDEIPVLE